MEQQIAYEMALLVKENRELREQVERLSQAHESANAERERLLEEILELKRGLKENVLIDANSDVNSGDYVSITKCTKSSKYEIGFVFEVDHIHLSNSGIKTLFGYYYWRDDVKNKDAKIEMAKINNKSYGWDKVKADTMSTLVLAQGSSLKQSFKEYDLNGKLIPCHYESENLINNQLKQ